MRSFRVFICALIMALGLSLASPPALAQGPTPSPSSTHVPSVYENANWSKYLAFLLAGLGVAVLGMAALGWLIQAPGFRKLEEEETE